MTLPDVQTLLYNPLFANLGVTADVESGGGGSATVQAIEDTKGIAVTDQLGVETIRPVAYVRMTELLANGIAMTDLADGTITLNGATWRIKAARAVPGPNGELAGQAMLILLSEDFGD